ncbi:MAG: YggS family pyridoxal phosphate-dependent enzyme [Candidatus Omnitrophica bacterium]|nr:YggS family pyridoxal phosphate-dependent enzyme [Candidatus Omnitrophota bacterium]
MSIRGNISVLRDKISKTAVKTNRNPSEIIVVCVSKNRKVEDIYEVLDSGINYIAENKVQEAQGKYADIIKYAQGRGIPLNFHMIGHLQTNKVNKALEMFSLIHSLDNLKLAQKINEVSKLKNKVTDVLVEVNTSEEKSKFGVGAGETINFLREISKFNNICVRGLMTMAPLAEDKEKSRPYFRKLSQLRGQIKQIKDPLFQDKIKMDFLSMGMSQDYEVAIQEGSNMLRIGTAIFEG